MVVWGGERGGRENIHTCLALPWLKENLTHIIHGLLDIEDSDTKDGAQTAPSALLQALPKPLALVSSVCLRRGHI